MHITSNINRLMRRSQEQRQLSPSPSFQETNKSQLSSARLAELTPDRSPFHSKKFKDKYFKRVQEIVLQQQLKNIVNKNIPYFRNIVQAKQLYKPNDHTLKIPVKTSPSLYKHQFHKRKPYNNIQGENKKQMLISNKEDHLRMTYSIKNKENQSNFNFKTSYQGHFAKQLNGSSNNEKANMMTRSSMSVEDFKKQKKLRNSHKMDLLQKPGFFDTQNTLQYRNWGNVAQMPSMKPKPQAATTNMPLNSKTNYRNDFKQNRPHNRTQIIRKDESFPKNVKLWMNNSAYQQSFLKPNNKSPCHSPKNLFKPKQQSGCTQLPFRSNTIYKQQFLKNNKSTNSIKNKHKTTIGYKQYSDDQIKNLLRVI